MALQPDGEIVMLKTGPSWGQFCHVCTVACATDVAGLSRLSRRADHLTLSRQLVALRVHFAYQINRLADTITNPEPRLLGCVRGIVSQSRGFCRAAEKADKCHIINGNNLKFVLSTFAHLIVDKTPLSMRRIVGKQEEYPSKSLYIAKLT